MFTESVCAPFASNGGGEGWEMAVAAPDGQSRQGPFMFVIAFCHLQRVLRILVKSMGNLPRNNYGGANYQVGNM